MGLGPSQGGAGVRSSRLPPQGQTPAVQSCSKELRGAACDSPAPQGLLTHAQSPGRAASLLPSQVYRPRPCNHRAQPSHRPRRRAWAPAASPAPSALTAACGVRCRSTPKPSHTLDSRCLGGSGGWPRTPRGDPPRRRCAPLTSSPPFPVLSSPPKESQTHEGPEGSQGPGTPCAVQARRAWVTQGPPGSGDSRRASRPRPSPSVSPSLSLSSLCLHLFPSSVPVSVSSSSAHTPTLSARSLLLGWCRGHVTWGRSPS